MFWSREDKMLSSCVTTLKINKSFKKLGEAWEGRLGGVFLDWAPQIWKGKSSPWEIGALIVQGRKECWF